MDQGNGNHQPVSHKDSVEARVSNPVSQLILKEYPHKNFYAAGEAGKPLLSPQIGKNIHEPVVWHKKLSHCLQCQ